jgi:predicted DNA-binding transcriptional regulator AlpA
MQRDPQQAVQTPRPLQTLYKTNALIPYLGISRRTFERLRAARKFPAPDIRIGRMNFWRADTVNAWIDSQAARQERKVA